MKSLKRILSLAAVVVLLGSIIAICVLLLNSRNYSDNIIRGLISCLIAIPLVAYGYMLILRYSKNLSNNLQKMTDEDIDN
jgi:ABC-type molybdate transport system permease subunit